MMQNNHHRQDQELKIDLAKLKKQILNNSLYLVAFEDINARYPEKYEVRRSSVLKKRMTNRVQMPYFQYHLFLQCEKTGFVDIGVIHPNDLVSKLEEHGDTIRITRVEVRRNGL